MFLWPGLQPRNGTDDTFERLGLGVLQPVLAWGPSSMPNQSPGDRNYSSWYIGGQYVNPGLNGTTDYGGGILQVQEGDVLGLNMTLSDTVWYQTIINHQSNKSASFAVDLYGQKQHDVRFKVEGLDSKPTTDVVFWQAGFTMRHYNPIGLQPQSRRPARFCFPSPGFTKWHLRAASYRPPRPGWGRYRGPN